MSVCRRFTRSKRGMSTIFGGLFFIILILMGFNVMLWGFIQYDQYNSIINTMGQRDQQAIAENLVPTNPGASDFNIPAQSFNITVNNLGIAVSIARIYVTNISPTGSNPICTVTDPQYDTKCVINPAPASPGFTLGNVQEGKINHKIKVTGLLINDGSGYRVVLASTRGRLFSFFYPWPVTVPNNGQGVFVTNIGPLSIFFDHNSFNFTQGSQTISNAAWCVPSSGNIVYYVKVSNSATDSTVTLRASTMMQMQPYTANGFGQFVRTWIVDEDTINPSNIIAYNNGAPTILPAADPSGPSGHTIVKFGANGESSSTGVSMSRTDNWIIFIGFFYVYRGQQQGQTIPFLAIKSVSSYPSDC